MYMKLLNLSPSHYNWRKNTLHVGDEVLVRNFVGKAIIKGIKHSNEVHVYFPETNRREVVTIDDILPHKPT